MDARIVSFLPWLPADKVKQHSVTEAEAEEACSWIAAKYGMDKVSLHLDEGLGYILVNRKK